MTTILTPELTAYWDQSDSYTLAGYRDHGGYRALPKALALEPDAVIQTLKDSVLRGRGGAGFPDGQAAEGATAGTPSLAGLRVAKEQGWTPDPGDDEQ